MSKVSNVLLMIEYLSNGRKYSIKELSEKLEVSPRMIRVYKNECEKAGIYIDTIKGPYGGYVINQDINIPKRFVLPKKINVNNLEVFNKINRAIKEHRKCEIIYYSKDFNEISQRIVHPYELILIKDEWIFPAFCEINKEIRSFYINRIKKIQILDEFFN